MNKAAEEIQPILLCCDLDRTLIPNGYQLESPQARPHFQHLCAQSAVQLVMVTGRHLDLVLKAIHDWQLPTPSFIIGDVGTSIYTFSDGQWRQWDQWIARIAPEWQGMMHGDIVGALDDITDMTLQPVAQQGMFKVSYEMAPDVSRAPMEEEVLRRLWALGVNARLIWSIDELADSRLLDIVPCGAGKLHAIEFLQQQHNYPADRTVFAGDSGNDLEVLGSHIPSILVANAHPEVQEEARQLASASGLSDTLYIAKGDFLDMNGNYAAGVLEGVAHFLPETITWMKPEE